MGSSETAGREPARARDVGTLYAVSSENVSDSADASAFVNAIELGAVRLPREKSRKLTDIEVLSAHGSISSGNSLRSAAKELGVSHEALRKRLKDMPADGYQLDDLDKALVRAVLDAGVSGLFGRLSEVTGWTRVELLEAVRR